MTNGTDESSVHENCNAKDTLSASASLTTTNDNEKANGEEVVKVIAAAQDGDKDCQTAEETTIVDDHSSSSSQLQLKISESCSSSTIDGGIGGEPAKEGQLTVEVEVVEPTTTDNIMSTGVLLESASAIVSPLEEGENEDQSATPTQTSCEHGDSMNIDNDKHGSEIPGNNQDSSDNTAPPKEDENGMITSPVLSSKVDNNNANKPDNSHENQDGNTLQNNNKSSSLFGDDLNEEMVAKVISEVETSSSVILSDAGETLTSTSPVINMTTSGMDSHDEKLLALGVFAKAANEDGDNTNIVKDFKKDAGSVVHESIDNNVDDVKPTIVAKSESEAKNSTSTRGDISPINTVPEKVVGENAIDAADIISSGLRKSTIPALSPSSFNSSGPSSGGYDKKRLNERLKLRLAKRNQMHSVTSSSPTKSVEGDVTAAVAAAPSMSSERDESRDRAQWETRLQAASRQKRQYKSRAKSEVSNNDGANSDILSRYSSSSDVVGGTRKIYPDTVTFSDGEDDDDDDAGPTSLRIDTKIASRDRRTAYRKCVSEVGASMAMSTRSSRSKLSKHHPTHHHGIGILQSDGIVYDDEMLLRLARQARFGRGRGEVSTTNSDDDSGRVNEVKIHVYDLLTKDSLVEVPYFNCQFPIGQCFRIVNSGCHTLGTGAYHVGVEINGVEYAFGANNIIGMSGIFTCVPKESPGYEYRETLDFGKIHTTKRTWIRVPKSTDTGSSSLKHISVVFGDSVDSDDIIIDKKSPAKSDLSSKKNDHLYSFREIDSFADGHAIVHSMAREYMGTDYDLLRKNCCTFARDVCIRLGVEEKGIPTWFHNAAQAGADAEELLAKAEMNVRRLVDCDGCDPLDRECYNHGFEVIMDEKDAMGRFRVVESPSMRVPRDRRPLSDSDLVQETASWTY